MKYAIIDIGSNSVRLMLWADGKTLYKKVATTRLAEGLDAHGKLSEEAMERTAHVVDCFVREGSAVAPEVYAFATAAVRSAENGNRLCRIIRDACGISTDVISGVDEARLAVLGALGDKKDGGILDIGGASTEICLIENSKTVFSCSLDIGAVRLHDSCGEDIAKLTQRIEKETTGLPISAGKAIYAVGGTASTLACLKHELLEYDPVVLQDTTLSDVWVNKTAEKLFSLTVEERKALRGMDKQRADILAGATLLLQKLMEKMGLKEVRFSDRDNLEGYLALKGLK